MAWAKYSSIVRLDPLGSITSHWLCQDGHWQLYSTEAFRSGSNASDIALRLSCKRSYRRKSRHLIVEGFGLKGLMDFWDSLIVRYLDPWVPQSAGPQYMKDVYFGRNVFT